MPLNSPDQSLLLSICLMTQWLRNRQNIFKSSWKQNSEIDMFIIDKKHKQKKKK